MSDDPGKKPSVLVVEDDPAMADLMQVILSEDGYAVHCAPDGKSAREFIARSAPPALVTLDITLPDASGIDLIVVIRDTPGWERVPIIMVTSRPKEQEVSWAIKSGAKAYIVKPFKPEELRDCVARVMRKRSAV